MKAPQRWCASSYQNVFQLSEKERDSYNDKTNNLVEWFSFTAFGVSRKNYAKHINQCNIIFISPLDGFSDNWLKLFGEILSSLYSNFQLRMLTSDLSFQVPIKIYREYDHDIVQKEAKNILHYHWRSLMWAL